MLMSLTLGCIPVWKTHKAKTLCLRNAFLVRYPDGVVCERHIGVPWDILCSPPNVVPRDDYPTFMSWPYGGTAILEWGVPPERGLYLRSRCERKMKPLPKEEL